MPPEALSTDLGLDHGWPLGAQYPHRVKHVHHALKLHPLQGDTERDEGARPTHARAVNGGNRRDVSDTATDGTPALWAAEQNHGAADTNFHREKIVLFPVARFCAESTHIR